MTRPAMLSPATAGRLREQLARPLPRTPETGGAAPARLVAFARVTGPAVAGWYPATVSLADSDGEQLDMAAEAEVCHPAAGELAGGPPYPVIRCGSGPDGTPRFMALTHGEPARIHREDAAGYLSGVFQAPGTASSAAFEDVTVPNGTGPDGEPVELRPHARYLAVFQATGSVTFTGFGYGMSVEAKVAGSIRYRWHYQLSWDLQQITGTGDPPRFRAVTGGLAAAAEWAGPVTVAAASILSVVRSDGQVFALPAGGAGAATFVGLIDAGPDGAPLVFRSTWRLHETNDNPNLGIAPPDGVEAVGAGSSVGVTLYPVAGGGVW